MVAWTVGNDGLMKLILAELTEGVVSLSLDLHSRHLGPHSCLPSPHEWFDLFQEICAELLPGEGHFPGCWALYLHVSGGSWPQIQTSTCTCMALNILRPKISESVGPWGASPTGPLPLLRRPGEGAGPSGCWGPSPAPATAMGSHCP